MRRLNDARFWLVGGALVLTAVGVTWWSQSWRVDHEGVTLAGQQNWSLMGAGGDADMLDKIAKGQAPMRALDKIRAMVMADPLIAQTQAAGSWAVDANGKLKPDLALRQRFEYYLLALGQVAPNEIRLLIEDEVKKAHGPRIAAEVMAIFDKYWSLRLQQPRNRLVLNERETWAPAFQEQKALRRQFLGVEWAEAFFSAEEQEFERFVAQSEGKADGVRADLDLPVPQMGPGKDVQAVHAERVALYGEAAAQRLAQADAEWAQWEQRLAGAKAEWQRLQASAELSELQRQQAIDQYIQAHFPADERIRAKGLLE